ncbi:MAG: nucleotidyltransferase domain-containing protein [Cytophagaceae bacterium]|nr:nucleotidyltransferase domain-containing protein [Cytophagaceae bacterium]MBK9935410.1 nucleotidyltransferase domain-containing protein [Cytophagaceae bacterium]MBL0301851.1 nucleotidyltransferase domain-containing protein [Cytophagaceae bacterium]MBL0324677.1 nucleotidyltransferase domain-containing protein [Cytophagaceae bacterium]
MSDIKPILVSFKKEVQNILGENLQDVILFGSYARGENSSESDIDLLMVLKNQEKSKVEYWNILGDTILKYDLLYNKLFSVKFASKKQYLNSQMPFYSELRKDGILI